MHTTPQPQLKPSVQSMFQQSLAVLFKPSIDTFERFEWRGGTGSAYTYVLIAALVSALVSGFFAMMPNHPEVTFGFQFLNRLVSILAGFIAFTGTVYGLSRALYKGTGTYAEVAYTFALFYVPISIVDSLLGWVPLVNYFMALAVPLILMFYGYIAVQSSTNVYDPNKSVVIQVVATIVYALVGLAISLAFGRMLVN